jgi:hypothetical protein
MGKRTKLREAHRRAVDEAIIARLRAHSQPRGSPGFIDCYCQFPASYREKIESYRSLALRAPERWRCSVRSRSPVRRFLGLVQFTFTAYPVPRHLEQAWIAPVAIEGLNDGEDFRRWYIAVGQGRSLYWESAHRYLSRLETHHFVNAPDEVESIQRAFWYAFARAHNADTAVAQRVARTKLSGFSLRSSFWREAARFFAVNPTSILEMNDLIDFIRVAKQEDANFSLRGRSLPALRRRMQEWHRELRNIACGGRWHGRRQPDTAYMTENGDERLTWRFRQIKTGEGLPRKGDACRTASPRTRTCACRERFRSGRSAAKSRAARSSLVLPSSCAAMAPSRSAAASPTASRRRTKPPS